MVGSVADKEAQDNQCPVNHMRKTVPPLDNPPAIEILENGVWRINGFLEMRQILRSEMTHQAGFGSGGREKKRRNIITKPPILFLEGEAHHTARRETNKFFTPSITGREYREFMNQYADVIIGRFQKEKQADLRELTMEMAVQVTTQIIGLTDSWFASGIKQRVEALIQTGNQRINGAPDFLTMLRSNLRTMTFYLFDVRPAIAKRRHEPKADVITYLLSQDYSDLEIVTECLVYGVAGMVTTREFISVAMWHLLENPALKERMLLGEEEERYAILHEILRLEPVIAHLYRRSIADMTIESQGEQITIPAGTQLDLHIVTANADETVVGEEHTTVCPAREMADLKPKAPAFMMSFGDGAHRCPGAYVAIQESDIFIRKLLALPGLRIIQEPTIGYFKIAEGYELRDFILAVD